MLNEIKIPDISKEIQKEDLLAILQNKYSLVGPLWVNQQMEWMNGIYASFKNHDKYLIVMYLLKKTLDFYSRNFIKLTYDEFYKRETVEIKKFNISEISNALNIPKESARRKINELEVMGVIKRFKKKIIIDRSSYEYIKPVHTVKRICRFLSAVTRICEAQKVLPKRITTEQLELTIKNNFSYIWKIYYEMQIPMMLSYKKIFKDLESFHIYGTCTVNQHLHSQRENKNRMDRDDFLKLILSKKVQGINAMSISDITEIPRATVIRKLQKLVKNKYLVIDDKKLYRMSAIEHNLKKPQKVVFNHLALFSTKIFNYSVHYKKLYR